MNKVLLAFIAIWIPPLAVGLRDGIKLHFWLNIALYLAMFVLAPILPIIYFASAAVLHALVIVLR